MTERSRDAAALGAAITALAGKVGQTVNLMEVCGTHTVAIFRHGLREFLPGSIRLLSGPGCPVCVTSMADIDTAIAYAKTPGVILTTFGDMMRVPGGRQSLNEAKAEGADVRVVYSPMDALRLAVSEPAKKIVFFATGFETTSPLVAATMMKARMDGVKNLFMHSVHKLVPPALRALVAAPELRVHGFILPGHVCTITGTHPYRFLGDEFGIPAVATGFDGVDILEGILMLMDMIRSGRPSVEIQYRGVVREAGNPKAVVAIDECFSPVDAYWRGIGEIPGSGLAIRAGYSAMNPARAIEVKVEESHEPLGCACGEILRGIKLPPDCPLFGHRCVPQNPVGACMVSTEGSCAAYYKYGNYK